MSVSRSTGRDPKPYLTPLLTVHGDIAELTESVGKNSKIPDNPTGPQSIKTF